MLRRLQSVGIAMCKLSAKHMTETKRVRCYWSSCCAKCVQYVCRKCTGHSLLWGYQSSGPGSASICAGIQPSYIYYSKVYTQIMFGQQMLSILLKILCMSLICAMQLMQMLYRFCTYALAVHAIFGLLRADRIGNVSNVIANTIVGHCCSIHNMKIDIVHGYCACNFIFKHFCHVITYTSHSLDSDAAREWQPQWHNANDSIGSNDMQRINGPRLTLHVHNVQHRESVDSHCFSEFVRCSNRDDRRIREQIHNTIIIGKQTNTHEHLRTHCARNDRMHKAADVGLAPMEPHRNAIAKPASTITWAAVVALSSLVFSRLRITNTIIAA